MHVQKKMPVQNFDWKEFEFFSKNNNERQIFMSNSYWLAQIWPYEAKRSKAKKNMQLVDTHRLNAYKYRTNITWHRADGIDLTNNKWILTKTTATSRERTTPAIWCESISFDNDIFLALFNLKLKVSLILSE